MNNLEDNYVIKFKNLSYKNDSIFANFIVKFIGGGITINSKIAIDISALELYATDSLETIINICGKKALKAIKQSEAKLKTFLSIPNNLLGVAQLG